MALIIQKYGGTSVGSVARIKAVADKVSKSKREGNQIIVVVSAMSGQTDYLQELAAEVTDNVVGRELDVLLSTGEQVTIALLAMALECIGHKAKSYTGSQVKILTNNVHNKARIVCIEDVNIKQDLEKGLVLVIAGFQGADEHGNITTLGRGGSDTTAVAIAAALQADECQIYTDVDGVYTADPRIESAARKMEHITYEEMLEMASLGSKVLQIRSVEFARKYNVPLRVLSSFEEGNGTIICEEDETVEEALISGIAHNKNEAKLTIIGVPDQPGIAHRILGPISDANIEVDMIVQNVGEDNTTDFTFTVNRTDFRQALAVLQSNAKLLNARAVNGDEHIAKISVVGVGMRSHAGIASKMFSALADEGINIMMISTSEIKISVVVDEKYLELGVRTLHSAFGLSEQ